VLPHLRRTHLLTITLPMWLCLFGLTRTELELCATALTGNTLINHYPADVVMFIWATQLLSSYENK
jgi:hypothetical protein